MFLLTNSSEGKIWLSCRQVSRRPLSCHPPTPPPLPTACLRNTQTSCWLWSRKERERAGISQHSHWDSPHWCATHSHECQTVALLSLHLHDFREQLKALFLRHSLSSATFLYSLFSPRPLSLPSHSALSKCCIITLGIILILSPHPRSSSLEPHPSNVSVLQGVQWRVGGVYV